MTESELAIFAKHDDGPLYVRVDAVMHTLCAFADRIPMTFFGREQIAYMPVTDAIKWCEKEGKFHANDRYRRMIENMKRQIELET